MNRILWSTGIVAAVCAAILGIWSGERTIELRNTASRVDDIKKELDEGTPRYAGSDPESDIMMRIETMESHTEFYRGVKSARDMLALAVLPLVLVSGGCFVMIRKRNASEQNGREAAKLA